MLICSIIFVSLVIGDWQAAISERLNDNHQLSTPANRFARKIGLFSEF
jgi:hypothetical protein